MNPVMWLDDIGKPAWIALMVVSFILFWPAGLVVLGFLIGSGRMACWTSRRGGGNWREGMERMQERAAQWCGPRAAASTPSSGNRALEVLRHASETLCAGMPAEKRPPALMMSLHIWALSHGIASLFARGDAGRRPLPMSPEDLLEAGVLVYLRGLGVIADPQRPIG